MGAGVLRLPRTGSGDRRGAGGVPGGAGWQRRGHRAVLTSGTDHARLADRDRSGRAGHPRVRAGGSLRRSAAGDARDLCRGGERAGFVLDGAFLFRAGAHDATAKSILGASFPAGGGLDEGHRVLDLLAAHPSTARHLARKLAVRFVSEAPPDELVDELADVFLATGGDLREVVRALAYSPPFWHADARQAKVKSPFELAVSALRALGADVRPTRDLVAWIDTMGQPLYRYQAPTGFPDRADHWVNAGALLNRMNFGLQLAGGHIPGVQVELLAFNGSREPATIEAALA
ncbi:MAG: DUF1800 family protein, partial [Nitriliruptorales bacterium]|nr:DUF1800 family protein [Nitriliruptorales bacterium]